MDEFEKKSVNLRLTLDIDDQLTWGELSRFVDLARTAGVDPDEPVGIATDDDDDELRVTGLVVYIHQDDLSTPAAPPNA